MNELILIESRAARDEQISSTSGEYAKELLAKVSALLHFVRVGSDEVVTPNDLAEFYGVTLSVLRQAHKRHFDEFESDGVVTVEGEEFQRIREELESGNFARNRIQRSKIHHRTRRITLWTPRGALRFGMLADDSEVANAVRTVLLNGLGFKNVNTGTERLPVDDRIDPREEIERHKYEIEKLKLQREIVNSDLARLNRREEIISNNSIEKAGFMLGSHWRDIQKIVKREQQLKGSQEDDLNKIENKSSGNCRLLLTILLINAGIYVEDQFLELHAGMLNDILYTLERHPDGITLEQFNQLEGVENVVQHACM
ncbi:MAG: ORF6N domain-containing protein [Cyanobacteria bacterium P01_E01_bin.6]